MNPLRLTVSQVRVAAACPRMAYFDADLNRRKKCNPPSVTRIWKTGDAETESVAGLGALFHQTIERFNKSAQHDPQVTAILQSAAGATQIAQELLSHIYSHYQNTERLFKAEGKEQQAFIRALQIYVGELADIIAYSLNLPLGLGELLSQLFGDSRRNVDVTFQVGPNGEPINIRGVLDYVFYDWRNGRRRIIDYKLTPSSLPTIDLFQVSLYALMHHVQHQTSPDVAVLYLHPQRQMLVKPWEHIEADRRGMFNFLASVLEWSNYDEQKKVGLKPPGEPLYCAVCRWKKVCVQRLGPKSEGAYSLEWTPAATTVRPATEPVQLREEPQAIPAENLEETVVDELPVGPLAPLPKPDPPPDPVAPRLWLGAWKTRDAEVHLPLAALPTHATVVGAAGSGKTWLAKVIVEEAIRQQVPVIAIDPQGDLVQFMLPRAAGQFVDRARAAYEQFCATGVARVFTPGTSHGERISLNPTRMASAQDLAHITDDARRQEEQDGMFEAVASNLVALAKVGGEEDSQRTFLYKILRSISQSGSREMDLKSIVPYLLAPDSAGIDQVDLIIKKAEREKLARKLNSLIEGPAARLFQGGQRLDLTELCRPTATGQTPLNVFYLNAMTDDDQKQFFVAALAAEIYRWMISSSVAVPGRPSLLFYIDEARDFMPAVGKPPAKLPLIRLFAQGRKYGVSCLFCTQSPRSVDYNVFGNCSTKIIGRMESEQDVERIAEWFTTAGPVPSWVKARKGAERGSFVARWPELSATDEGEVFQSRMLFSTHEGAWSPDRLEAELKRQKT